MMVTLLLLFHLVKDYPFDVMEGGEGESLLFVVNDGDKSISL